MVDKFKYCSILSYVSSLWNAVEDGPPDGLSEVKVSVERIKVCEMPCSEDDDSQTGFLSEPGQPMSKAELRKTNKPIMEKKRRARINHCLNELKDLLMDATDKDPARHSKLEKADILELTVKHLQTLQRQQLAAAIAADPAVLQRFKAGFGDCAVEVRRYLSRLATVPAGIRYRLGNHLNSCISGIERLNPDYPPLVPDPLRLDDERPSAFHYVRAMQRPTSPPLSPLSCDSACDSSTELETPPRPVAVQKFPFPTPPSHSASDQDSSPEQKATVSSTTISPETLKQEALRTKKFMEPLSIVIDVENYKIGIDASPKRAIDYSMRQKLKRHSETIGPAPKLIRLETEKSNLAPKLTDCEMPSLAPKLISFDTEKSLIPEKLSTDRLQISSDRSEGSKAVIEKSSAFKTLDRVPSYLEKKLTLPESIPAAMERHPANVDVRPIIVPRTVISHTAESLAQSSFQTPHKVEVSKEKAEADTSSKSPQQSTSSSEMWRPW